jgi:hypothetical protein
MKLLALTLLAVLPLSASAGMMEDIQSKGVTEFLELAPGAAIPAISETNEDALFSMAQSVTDMNRNLSQTLTGVESIAVIVPLMAADKQERGELIEDVQDFSKSVDDAAVKSQNMSLALRRISPAQNSLGARALLNNTLQARATAQGLRTHAAVLEAAIEAQGDKLSFKTVQLAKELIAKTDVLAKMLDGLAQGVNASIR